MARNEENYLNYATRKDSRNGEELLSADLSPTPTIAANTEVIIIKSEPLIFKVRR